MVKCQKCNNMVENGKFCEKCGASLDGAIEVSEVEEKINKLNINSKVGGFFDNIKSSMNKAATDLMAIKSNYNNGVIINVINKIPSVQEKKIIVDNKEVVYFNNGNGYEQKYETFTTFDKDFKCCYIEKSFIIPNSLSIEIMSPIKKLNDTDKIKVIINYDLSFKVDDYDKLFHELINIKQDSWKIIDINSLLSDNIKKIVNEKTIELLLNDGNLDLRDVKKQISAYAENISPIVNTEILKYGLSINTFNINNVVTDMYEINKILIANLYK